MNRREGYGYGMSGRGQLERLGWSSFFFHFCFMNASRSLIFMFIWVLLLYI